MFKSEKELVGMILKRFESKGIGIKKYRRNNIEVLTELNLGFGIPDIVVINKKKNGSMGRESSLNFFDITLLDIIKREKKVSLDDIVNITKSSRTKVSGSLSLLVNEDIIKKNSSNTFSYLNYQIDIMDCIAIEVKLKNWKRALFQAYRYKWFAHESYVMLPENNLEPALNRINEFVKLNVGLISFNKNGNISVHFKPIRKTPISEKMYYFLNEKLFALV